ncbi:DUF3857 domain-containing protein [Saccharicrinis sp. FJH2]|uniref:DUF3857 domain-containing protein n=1 Tax=Saccharicrinis sp. FJH65 TaxID=3344659 RepID=UPI0035F467B7
MKSLFIVILAILLTTNHALGTDPDYDIRTIPDNLKENADVVIRLDETECTVYSKTRVKIKYNRVITILNERGLEAANIMLPYSSLFKVSYPSGAIYKADGKKYKSIKAGDVYDVSAITETSLYDDSRIKIYEPPLKTTPFTIAYSYEETYDGTMFLPTWTSYEGYNIALEKSVFKVIVNEGLDFKYKEQAVTKPAKTEALNNSTSYYWEVTNQPAPKYEPLSTSITKEFPTVFTALNEFEAYHVEGNSHDWDSFARWRYTLIDGRNELPEKTVTEITDLTKDKKDVREKVETVYRYMQDKCHYVNVSEDIGGWQPIEAKRVDEVGYGDCKALSNYTKSLLDVIGIKSYYTVIKAGEDMPDFNADFVSNQFNHVILCIPNQNDTIWLECTDMKMPAGYLSTFTDDRYALLIDKDSSKLVKTPRLTGPLNSERRKAIVNIHNDLSADFNVVTYYSGEYENEIPWWYSDDNEKKRRSTYESLSFSDIRLDGFNYQIRGDINAIEEKLNFRVLSAGTLMGSRIIFEINKLNKETYSPKKVFKRRSNLEIQRTMLESDTIEYILPEGYILEAQIKPIKIISDFGNYEATIKQVGNKLTYIRSARFNKGIYDKSQYADFVKFFQDIKSADQQKVLLKPQNG